MCLLLSIVIQTANILGIFTDPFEFDGDYGKEVNSVRQKVFEELISREAMARNLTDPEVRARMGKEFVSEEEISAFQNNLTLQAIQEEKEYGPTLRELVTPELIKEINSRQIDLKASGFTDYDYGKILNFIERYKGQKNFRFLRNNPSALLTLDKVLRDQAARDGIPFDLPILGSTEQLLGSNSLELKLNLIKAVFTEKTFHLTKPQESIRQSLNKLNCDYLKDFFGTAAKTCDLDCFSSASSQVFFYWMYQALNLQLISTDQEMIEKVNQVKHRFSQTLGNSAGRAKRFKEKLVASGTEVLFTQEGDALVPQILINDGLFIPVHSQNLMVVLRSDAWEADYTVLPIESYEGFQSGKINLILAKRKGSGERFLLASCHGNSTKAEDGRLQISLVMEKFHELSDGNL